MKQYNNDLTAEILASFNKPTFTPEQIADMADSAKAVIAKLLFVQTAYFKESLFV